MALTEAQLEEMILEHFKEIGYQLAFGPDIAPNGEQQEREDYGQVVLLGRLRNSLRRLNPGLDANALAEAERRIIHTTSPSLLSNNRSAHKMLIEGVPIESRRKDGSTQHVNAKIIDFDNPSNNEFLAVNQFTVVENKIERRADIVLFINGLPVVVIELKNPADEKATIWTAFNQLQTYKAQIPSLFQFNAFLVISDGIDARMGTISADKERFLHWLTMDGKDLASATALQSEVLLKGMCDKGRLLDIIRHFIVFEETDKGLPIKKIAGYHQYHAVNHSVAATLKASSAQGDRRIGVVWHTQGSGKSLTMVFYAGKLVLEPSLHNPTIVIITDRNDLDDQLFSTFNNCHELLRQHPVQAASSEHLRELLRVASGGIIFTTIQKFLPEGDRNAVLSDRRNIVVIADEAHRSQYDFIDGYARHMRDALPNASFIGFTGTPLELDDKNTRYVFGDYISIYDIQRAVEDGATVPIYYESRLAKIELPVTERPHLDAQIEELTESEELTRKEQLKAKWAALEALVGSNKRIKLIAKDIVDHFEKRQQAIEGKAMIVCMSRRIAIELYYEIIKLRPNWHSEDDDKGVIKIIMTGSASDPVEWQKHIRNKARREKLAIRFKDPKDDFKLVILRDMWLTGFDVPCLHTMYIDKPMQGHGLMQTIARVNRVFRDKPGGLIVDYIGLGDQLRSAMAFYTQSGGRGSTAIDQEEAIMVMLEKYEICRDFFHGFDYKPYLVGDAKTRIKMLPAAQEHILSKQSGKDRFVKAAVELSRAFALAVPSDQALKIRDEVAFFQEVKSVLIKSGSYSVIEKDIELAVRQIISGALLSDRVIDIFEAAGLKKPNISILSDEFLAEVQSLPQKNLALALLQRLLMDGIRTITKKNLVQARAFSDRLMEAITRYEKRATDTMEIIQALIELAKDMREASKRGEELGLSERELAFYDSLGTNDSAVAQMGNATLCTIAKELAKIVKQDATIDWQYRESARAKMRTHVKRLLRKYNYPPDKQDAAVKTVIEQAELLSQEIVSEVSQEAII
ncbi:MAG: type I restriction endonuclease subunit R [Methanomassiliicoccales archaeon]|nr:MAG: type I restriction endonuclease subunit R [Methanomassiliicoccales archaeon]